MYTYYEIDNGVWFKFNNKYSLTQVQQIFAINKLKLNTFSNWHGSHEFYQYNKRKKNTHTHNELSNLFLKSSSPKFSMFNCSQNFFLPPPYLNFTYQCTNNNKEGNVEKSGTT